MDLLNAPPLRADELVDLPSVSARIILTIDCSGNSLAKRCIDNVAALARFGGLAERAASQPMSWWICTALRLPEFREEYGKTTAPRPGGRQDRATRRNIQLTSCRPPGRLVS